MKKVSMLLVLVCFLSVSLALAEDNSYKNFITEVNNSSLTYGRPEIVVESTSKLIIMFAAGDKFKTFELDKLTMKYRVFNEKRYATAEQPTTK
jgi:hypothetical protein